METRQIFFFLFAIFFSSVFDLFSYFSWEMTIKFIQVDDKEARSQFKHTRTTEKKCLIYTLLDS